MQHEPWAGEFHLRKLWWLNNVRYFHPIFCYILWKVRSTNNLTGCFHWESYVDWVMLGTFTQTFGYILWKVRSNMNHRLVSFIWERMLTWVRLGTFTNLLVTFCGRWEAPWIGLASFIWESYGDLSKVRYFHPIFWLHSVEDEKHHELDWWASSEKVMVTWVRLGTFTQSFGYILWKVRNTKNHGLVSFIWESYSNRSKVYE